MGFVYRQTMSYNKSMNCPYCHKPLHEGDVYCSYCGKRVNGKREKTAVIRPLIITVIMCVLVVGITLFVCDQSAAYPKGMYVLYDENGSAAATMSLRSDGTYVLNDKQNYSGYITKDDVPIVVFHHQFSINEDGLQWKETIQGKMKRDEADPSSYILEDFFGGLFDHSQNAVMFVSDEAIYLYPEDDDSEVIVMEKPQ